MEQLFQVSDMVVVVVSRSPLVRSLKLWDEVRIDLVLLKALVGRGSQSATHSFIRSIDFSGARTTSALLFNRIDTVSVPHLHILPPKLDKFIAEWEANLFGIPWSKAVL